MMNAFRFGLASILFSAQLAWSSAATGNAANEATAMPVVTPQVADQMANQVTSREPASEANTILSATADASNVKKSLNENEIPLTVDLNKKNTETASNSARLFLTVMILLGILGATYYVVRRYKLSNNVNKSNTRIKILSQHYLGPKKSLAIIHVAGESMLIGVTDSNISMIKSLSLIDDEVPADLPKNFSDTLQTETVSLKDIKNEKSANQRPAGASAKAVNVEELEEEFSFSGIKDSVSKKLKSMRSLS